VRGLLTGRVALVTGGASGLGEAIAHRFADEGATVVIGDIDAAGAQSVADAIVARGHNALAVVGDVTRTEDVESMVDAAASIGPLRALVLSAAVESFTPVIELSDEEWQRILDVDLKGPFLAMRAGIPHLVANGGGSVIALGSTLGLIVAPGHPAYCAAKGALVNLCKQAAIEHAPDNVRVNVLAPSATDTGLFWKVSEASADPEGMRSRVANANPMKRLGSADEVCDAALFLASDQSTYVSGTVIALDGGMAARRM